MNIKLFLEDFKDILKITDKVLMIDLSSSDLNTYLDFFINKSTFSFLDYIKLVSNIKMINNDLEEVILIRSLIIKKAKNTFKEISDFSKIIKLSHSRSINQNYFFNTFSGKFKYIIGNVPNICFKNMKYDMKNIIKKSDLYFGMPKLGSFFIDKAFEENLKLNGILALDFLPEYNIKKYNKLFRKKYIDFIYGFSFKNEKFNIYFTNNKKNWKEIYLNGKIKKFKTIEEWEEFKSRKLFLNEQFTIISDNRFYENDYFNYKVTKKQLLFNWDLL